MNLLKTRERGEDGKGVVKMLKRISWRVQPIEQIKKHKQRRRDMWERHQQFVEFVEREKRKKGNK